MKKRKYIPAIDKNFVFKRDNYSCKICNSSDDLEVDHIIPFALGGECSLDNFQTLCSSCNSKKGIQPKGYTEYAKEFKHDSVMPYHVELECMKIGEEILGLDFSDSPRIKNELLEFAIPLIFETYDFEIGIAKAKESL